MTETRKIAVIGAGLMGHGIAQAFAQKGWAVGLFDLSEAILDRARQGVRENLETFVEMGWESQDGAARTLERIVPDMNLARVVKDAELVMEAAPEDLDLKRGLFKQIDKAAAPEALLASNTSMLPISDFGSEVADQGRLVITHWFNPPHIVPVVEVVCGRHTSEEARDRVFAILSEIGKTPVMVRREVPGFLVNRIQTAMFREVLALLEGGVASAEDIDKAIQGSFGLRLSVQGVLKTMDLAGLDLMLKGCSYLFGEIAANRDAPQILKDKVSLGDLGAKSGRGFFSYDRPAGGAGPSPARQRDRALLRMLKALQKS
jgi:3-hydroxybutyryl-CoA dehydrogenase